MKSFNFRSYSSKFFRPSPKIVDSLTDNLLVIATPWGAKSGAENAAKIVEDFYLSSRGDRDSTSPFEYLTCLSQEANILRTSILLANDKIYLDDNKSEYTSGCEILALSKTENKIQFAQVGQPSLFLSRKNCSTLPISCTLDMSFNIGDETNILSPLPNQMIGLYESANITIQSMKVQPNDKLIFISRTFIPKEFFALNHDQMTLQSILQVLTKNNSDNPFWIGLLEL